MIVVAATKFKMPTHLRGDYFIIWAHCTTSDQGGTSSWLRPRFNTPSLKAAVTHFTNFRATWDVIGKQGRVFGSQVARPISGSVWPGIRVNVTRVSLWPEIWLKAGILTRIPGHIDTGSGSNWPRHGSRPLWFNSGSILTREFLECITLLWLVSQSTIKAQKDRV